MSRLSHAVLYARKLAKKRRATEKPSFVYLLKAGDFVKIGIADDVARRLVQLQTGNPIRIKLAAMLLVKCPLHVERSIHAVLKPLRASGEWFFVSDADAFAVIEGAFYQLCKPHRVEK